MKLILPLRAVCGPACGDKLWEPCQSSTGVPRTSPHRDRFNSGAGRWKSGVEM
jgi:hypothetical protein